MVGRPSLGLVPLCKPVEIHLSGIVFLYSSFVFLCWIWDSILVLGGSLDWQFLLNFSLVCISYHLCIMVQSLTFLIEQNNQVSWNFYFHVNLNNGPVDDLTFLLDILGLFRSSPLPDERIWILEFRMIELLFMLVFLLFLAS